MERWQNRRAIFQTGGVWGLSLLPFLPALWGGFLNWDDGTFVVGQANYRGFSPSHLVWMFSTNVGGHFMPLTWLSYAVDHALWGMRPMGFHLTNLLLHGANAVLLFALMRKKFHISWLPALGATLFWAWHPLRVESVVWVTQRRDVLSAFFLLLAAWFWSSRETERVGKNTLAAFLCFLLSLLSKATGIVFPAVLTLWELWRKEDLRNIIRSLWPYWGMALLFAVGAAHAQWASNATLPVLGDPITWIGRLLQCLTVVPLYLWKMGVPWPLTPYIEFPVGFPWESGVFWLCAPVSLGLIVLAVQRRMSPALLFALGTTVLFLLPVSGVFQSGRQFMAEHYTYLASMPLSVWGGKALSRPGQPRWGARIGAIGGLILWAGMTLGYSHVWGDSVRLWTWAREARPTSAEIELHLAGALYQKGDRAGAAAGFARALAWGPDNPKVLLYYGDYLMNEGRTAEAVTFFDRSLRRGGGGEAFERMGNWLVRSQRFAEAEPYFAQAAVLKPSMWEIYCGWGVALLEQSKPMDALPLLERAEWLSPKSFDVQNNLSLVYLALGRVRLAQRAGEVAVTLNPTCAPCWANLSQVYGSLGEEGRSVLALKNATNIDPHLLEHWKKPAIER